VGVGVVLSLGSERMGLRALFTALLVGMIINRMVERGDTFVPQPSPCGEMIPSTSYVSPFTAFTWGFLTFPK